MKEIQKRLSILDKEKNETLHVTAREFLNPDTETFKGNSLKPKTYHQSYMMLMGLIEGDIYQNSKYAITLDLKKL